MNDFKPMEPREFLIIDDDPISNLLTKINIKSYFKDASMLAFTNPLQAFSYLRDHYSEKQCDYAAIVFLDINMPVWNAWDFLENYEKLNEDLKCHFKIYIMSSSIDSNDVKRAAENKHVIDYIIKPINKQSFAFIANDYQIYSSGI